MPIAGRPAIDRGLQAQAFGNGRRAHIDIPQDSLPNPFRRNMLGSKGFHKHVHRLRQADGIAQLHLAFFRPAGRHHIFGDIPRQIRPAAVHLGWVFAGKSAAPMAGIAAIGIGNDLAPREARIPRRAAHHKPSRRVDKEHRVFVQKLRGQRGNRMTGEIATDVSDASLTFFVDLPKRRWSDKMIDKIGIPRDILPERLLESTEPAGRLRADLAARWGIRAGTVVAAGAGDQPACGVGSDVARSGVVGSSIGTSGAVFGCIDHPFVIEKPCAAYSMCHAVPDEWCFLGLSLTSGASFKWLRDTVFAEKKAEMALKKGDIYGYMTGLAQKADPGCEGLLFLPYLNGDKTPNNDKAARGVWFGLSQRHGVNELCRSVMEGVTFSLRDSLELLREQGMEVQEVHASGGGAKSSLWRQIQADIFHAPVMTMNVEESPAAGAAIIAGVAAGVFRNIQEGCDCMIRVTEVTEPIESHAKIYDDYFQEYRQLYASLKKNFMDQNRIVQKYSV